MILSDLKRAERDLAKLLSEDGPMKISEAADELGWTHEKTRRTMNNLSRQKLVVSLPNFDYEYVGEQSQKKPEETI